MASYANTIYEQFNQTLDSLSKSYENVAKKSPLVDKIVILANHILRLIPMIALMQILPFTALSNTALMLTGGLFYRITIERLCPLRFALLSSIGAIAFDFALAQNLELLGCLPLSIYAISVIYTAATSTGVRAPQVATLAATSCCSAK